MQALTTMPHAGYEQYVLLVGQDDNSLTAIGKALALAGRYLKAGTLLQAGSSQTVRLWAVQPPSGGVTLIALNKALNATQQLLQLSSCQSASSATVVAQLTGTSYTDDKPVLAQPANGTNIPVTGGQLLLVLPPTSITVLTV